MALVGTRTSRATPPYDIRIDGEASAGSAELVEIPRAADAPSEGGFTGAVPDAISGVMTWTCEPPRGEPTPIEGTWFRIALSGVGRAVARSAGGCSG